MNNLSTYEKQQFDAILEWQLEEPGIVTQTVGAMFKPVSWLVGKVIPESAIEKALSGLDAAAEWLADKQDILRDGGVAEVSELRYKSLELSDLMANNVHNWANAAAGAEGGAAGALGLPGMIADLPTLITMGLRVIHKIAACYGYVCETEEDKKVVFAIMSAAGANSIEEKTEAIKTIKMMGESNWKQMANNSAVKAIGMDATVIVVKALAKQLSKNLTERKAFQAIPVLGIGVGAAMNVQFINDIAWAARRTYQQRWLEDNGKINLG